MNGESLWRLLTKDGRWQSSVMHIVGTAFVVVGGLLDEMGRGHSTIILVGLILWGIAEGQLLRALKQDIDRSRG